MNAICPSCHMPFSLAPLTTPHILPNCSHTLCSGCIQHAGIVQCPLSFCQAHIPRQSLDMFPVNRRLLGQVLLRQLDERKEQVRLSLDKDRGALERVGCEDVATCSSMNRLEFQQQQVTRELASTLVSTRSFLARLKKKKQQLEAESSCYEKVVPKLSDHLASCHAELEMVRHRMMAMLDQQEEKRIVGNWEKMGMSNNLINIFEKPADFVKRVELVIDENIFSAFENNLDGTTNSEGPELAELLSINDGKMVTIDGDDRSEYSSNVEDIPSEAFPLSQAQVVFDELEPVEVIWVETPGSFFVRRMVAKIQI